MTKTFLSAALIAGFGIAAFAPQVANASDGTITFTGKVLSSTCAVSNATAGVVTVVLPAVQSSALAGVATVAGLTPFALTLTGCPTTPSAVVVGAAFDQTNVDAATGAIKNTTGSGYSTAQVQMTTGTGTAINLNSNPNPVNATIDTSGNATLSYKAQYYAKAATTTPGLVNASVAFTLTYN